MAVTQYIGSRYVTAFADPIEWSSTKTYEALTVVQHNGDSYVSKQFVPIGIDISDDKYWLHWADYNAQIEQYRRETAQAVAYTDEKTAQAIAYTDEKTAEAINKAEQAQSDIDLLLPKNEFSQNKTVKQYIDDKTNSFVTPEMFGAIGDGVADDSAAFESCFAENKLVLLDSNKIYALQEGIIISNNIHINGAGATILNLTGSPTRTTPYLFTFESGCVIENIKFNSNNTSRGSIRVAGGEAYINDCHFTGYSLRYGYYQTDSQILSDSSENITVENCTFYNNGYEYGTATNTLNRCITSQGSNGKLSVLNCTFDTVNQAIVCTGLSATIKGCFFTKVSDNVVYDFTEKLIFSNNIIYECEDEGVITQGTTIVDSCIINGLYNRNIGINNDMVQLIISNCVFTDTYPVINTRNAQYKIDMLQFVGNTVNTPRFNLLFSIGVVNTALFSSNSFYGTNDPTASAADIVLATSVASFIFTNNIVQMHDMTTNLYIRPTLTQNGREFVSNNMINDNKIRFRASSEQTYGVRGIQSGVDATLQNIQPEILITSDSQPPTTAPRGSICATYDGALYVKAANWIRIGG